MTNLNTPPPFVQPHFLDHARCSCCTKGFLESDNWERCGNLTYAGEYKGPRHPPTAEEAAYLSKGEPIHHAECTCHDCVPGVELLSGLATGLWCVGMCAKARGEPLNPEEAALRHAVDRWVNWVKKGGA